MENLFKNLLSQNKWADFNEALYVALKLKPIIVCSNDNPGLTMTYFTARSNLQLRISYLMGKCGNDGLFGNYFSLYPGSWLI